MPPRTEVWREVQDDGAILSPPSSPSLRKGLTSMSMGVVRTGSIERSGFTSRNLSHTRPLQEIPSDTLLTPEEAADNGSFRVLSLNLGGRNSNPLEFELKGDSSPKAASAASIMRKAGKALRSAQEGPLLMPAPERELVGEILAEIFEGTSSTTELAQVHALLQCETWELVLARVKTTNVHFFNALNLSTLHLGRPSVLEDPCSCRALSTMSDYLLAWKKWYKALDRSGKFWLEDAPRAASKRCMDLGTAFAGILLFDTMCLCTARHAMEQGQDQESDAEREVHFKELASFAGQLPASSLTKKHLAAKNFAIGTGAHALLLRESFRFTEQPTIEEEFMPPVRGADGLTKIFLKKGSFDWVEDITAALAERMEALLDAKAPPESQKAWRSATTRMAAVHARCVAHIGGFQVCLVSLHCAKHGPTGDYIEALRSVLEDYNAELYVVASDANCSGTEAELLQRRLSGSGLDCGCEPKQQQVTVAKQRTAFQTQVDKIGETDISHKDYILSWASPGVRRGPTSYSPDLRTPYGVEQETRQCVRLPTTSWPFDHCGVNTSFQRRSRWSDRVHCTWSLFGSCILAASLFALIALPLASPNERPNPYGEPGTWYPSARTNAARRGICEATSPCKEGWVQRDSSCYLVTPRVRFNDSDALCRASGGTLVSIGSEEENQFVTRHLCPKGDFCYIGLHSDFDGEASWWDSGEPLNYTHLVMTVKSAIPLFPKSRAADSRSTILSNLPGEVSGCRGSLSLPFRVFESVEGDWINVAAAIAMAVSGICWMLPRPAEQHGATWFLRFSFVVNTAWYLQRVLASCFTSDYFIHQFVFLLGNKIDWYGHTLGSLFLLWLIIKRVMLLCPADGPVGVFVGIVLLLLFNTIMSVFWIDEGAMGATLRPSWLVLDTLVSMMVIFLCYVEIGNQLCRTLYEAWVVMKREATIGHSTHGRGALDEGARAAKLQFLSVCAAISSGALRVIAGLAIIVSYMMPVDPMWAVHFYMAINFLVSVTNDICVYFLATLNMDAAVVRAKGVTAEVAERAGREVEQHSLAVRMLTAAPTSAEQLCQLALLEQNVRDAIDTEQENQQFLILQSAIRVESARIHRLMRCVRLRAMTMPVRYAHLMDIPVLDGQPRQHVPQYFAGAKTDEAAEEYFRWLYAEAPGAQQVLFRNIKQLLANFNKTPWPADLGLAQEEFPWTIWPHGPQNLASRRIPEGDAISPGDILLHVPRRRGRLEGEDASRALCVVLEECDASGSYVRVHRSGKEQPEDVHRRELRSCNGGVGVFVPGPKKKEPRCRDKIQADYAGRVPFPAAASLVDICRCQILLDDPYALAVFVASLAKNVHIVRMKNRFSEDVMETLSPEELQTLFYGAADSPETHAGSTASNGDYQYRDVSINLEITTPDGVPFICEVQVTLSNLAVLKHADQSIYTVRRMKSPRELLQTHVFLCADRKARAVHA